MSVHVHAMPSLHVSQSFACNFLSVCYLHWFRIGSLMCLNIFIILMGNVSKYHGGINFYRTCASTSHWTLPVRLLQNKGIPSDEKPPTELQSPTLGTPWPLPGPRCPVGPPVGLPWVPVTGSSTRKCRAMAAARRPIPSESRPSCATGSLGSAGQRPNSASSCRSPAHSSWGNPPEAMDMCDAHLR